MSTSMVSFTYRLTSSGNAEATIAYGADQATLYVSYLSNALRDLTVAVSILLTGAKSSKCVWFSEPGEYRWLFTHRGDTMWIRAVGFREWEQDRPLNDRGRMLFKAHCPLTEFAAAVLHELERLNTSIGPADYKRLWVAHEFHMAEYKRLRDLTIART